jgi:hypothetical protein
MDTQIITIFVLCDELLNASKHHEDAQCKVSDAEIMTVAIAATSYFHGNFEKSGALLKMSGAIPTQLSRSQFNRRLHRLKSQFVILFEILGQAYKTHNAEATYLIDTFPIPACDNIRIRRARRYQGEEYRGYTASKRRFFYGLKIHLMVTKSGQPVECFFTPGRVGDVEGLQIFAFDLPKGSTVYADKAYNDYDIENLLEEAGDIHLMPIRKKNSKRLEPAYVEFVQHYERKQIETVGSLIERLLPKHIHAVTDKGFELKVFLFVLAYSITTLYHTT